MDRCTGGKGVRRIYDYLIGFRDATQDFRLNAKVSPDLDVMELHNTFVIHGSNLDTLLAKYECVIR